MERINNYQNKERFPGSISVSLLLTHGRSGRLLLTRHGLIRGDEETWGPIAGGVEKGENAWEAALREAQEEANICPQNIIFVKGRDSLEPHVALINRENKNSLGLVYSVTYSGSPKPLDGWSIEGDKNVDFARFFTWKEILGLLDNENKIYHPDFNVHQLLRWTVTNYQNGSSRRKAETSRWLSTQSRTGLNQDSNGEFVYLPPYNDWMNARNIHGDPSKTNFARERFLKS